jgi:hypothetical protein
MSTKLEHSRSNSNKTNQLCNMFWTLTSVTLKSRSSQKYYVMYPCTYDKNLEMIRSCISFLFWPPGGQAKNQTGYVQSLGSIALSWFSKMDAWWPYLNSDWAKVWWKCRWWLYVHTRLECSRSNSNETCLLTVPFWTLTSVIFKSRSNQKPRYYVMYHY